MTQDVGGPTNIGLAVAVVTLARFIRVERPGLQLFLKLALDDAAASGLAEGDLRFMKTLIGAIPPKGETEA